MDACPEVGGIACVRVAEALAMRDVGVTKPILVMAVSSEDEIVGLVRHCATPSVWDDGAAEKLDAAARSLGRPVPVELFIDTGMDREGMPYDRARQSSEPGLRQPNIIDLNRTCRSCVRVKQSEERSISSRYSAGNAAQWLDSDQLATRIVHEHVGSKRLVLRRLKHADVHNAVRI